MTEEEKFIVDLEGYLVIKNVLTTNEVSELNRLIDEENCAPLQLRGAVLRHLFS